MSVYVDDYRARYGRMRMSHLTADSIDELQIFASRLGLKPEWFQRDHSTPHYDVCESKRRMAIALGAVPETAREGARRRLALKRAAA